jgi:hypothetical protein
MATPTANYGFIKDAPTQLYDVAVVNANLDAIDTTIKARETNTTALTTRVTTLEQKFTTNNGIVYYANTLFTAATGWSIVDEDVHAWGPMVHVSIVFKRTGAKITAGADGNVGNTRILNWQGTRGNWVPVRPAGIAPSYTGCLYGAYIDGNGVTLASFVPNQSLDTNEQLSGSACYIRDMVV